MNKKAVRYTYILILLLILPGLYIFAEDGISGGKADLQKGIDQFASSNYEDALHYFRDIILDPTIKNLHGDAYFWLSKTYLALNNLDSAEKNLEYFLMNYEGHRYFPEALYQKGRLLFLQREYEKSIQVLYNFIDQYPKNPYVGNSYYWIGESLYELGHLDKASKIFQIIVDEFPRSYKVEAAKYRISVIALKYREQELMKFLKWSHEEALKTLEEFQIREKTYEQAIAAYQKKLAEYAEAGAARKIDELTLDVREKEAEIVRLQNNIQETEKQISEKNATIENLQNKITELSAAQQAQPAETPPVTVTTPAQPSDKLKELLKLKEEALDLKSYYLDWLERHMES